MLLAAVPRATGLIQGLSRLPPSSSAMSASISLRCLLRPTSMRFQSPTMALAHQGGNFSSISSANLRPSSNRLIFPLHQGQTLGRASTRFPLQTHVVYRKFGFSRQRAENDSGSGSRPGQDNRSKSDNQSRSNSQHQQQQQQQQQASPSLGARLKKLSKEYGWAAVGVYFALSVLDFPFCFLLVRIIGTEKMGEIEHFVVAHIKQAVPESVQDLWHRSMAKLRGIELKKTGDNGISEMVEMAGWGVEEAEQRSKAGASLATQLAFAYAIHKSFIFARVPLTAAVTPKVVKTLRSWGWKVGKK